MGKSPNLTGNSKKSLLSGNKYFRIIALLLFLAVPVLAFSGCASMSGTTSSTTSTSGMSAGNMNLQTKMSSSIFLQPVPPSEKIVYVRATNTSSATGLNFKAVLEQALIARGYRITNNPQDAYFMLMSNVLYLGKETHAYTAAGALAGGFGGALIGSRYGSTGSTLVGGGLGALAGGIIGAMFQHKKYMMVVDIQLEQRQKGSYTTNGTATSEGLGNTTTTYNAGVKNWAIYRDRVVATASAINLRFSSAEPALKTVVGREISNLL
ncbi:MAG: conjugal transfer protein TraT [Candidatus Acididesulfobacter guangdongensis]|uniref:Conjugal transfer protein TraT n=1 Tax=Acididesulfobacter guangdongensis TaxID=2597225 RepID=A0A519BJL0_ACIG2|nr:MAG: conjugal transfer protein TraT [Candidatus Acididesulfobacter guangdongensis]